MKVWSQYEESPGSSMGIKIKRMIQSENDRNGISVMDTDDFGRILHSGSTVLFSDCGEDPYHEMLAILPVTLSPSVRSVLLVGGSDGATLGLLTRITAIEKIVVAGTDTDALEAVNTWFASSASAFTDKRVKFEPRDGTDFVRDSRERFDLIIIDIPGAASSSEYPQSFFCDCFRLLSSDGAIVVDCGPHGFLKGRRELGTSISKLKRLFPVFRLYSSPGVLPGFSPRLFAFATKTFDPAKSCSDVSVMPSSISCSYINPSIIRSAFSLPEYLHRMIEGI